MLRTFQFRLQPNATQRIALEYILADLCETYNAALQERRDAWKIQRKSVTYRMQQSQITELRKDPAFRVVAADIQRDPLRRVDGAFRAFFRRCKSGKGKPGFPRFRSLCRYRSFTFGGNRPVVRAKSIHVPNVGDIRMRGGRPIHGIARTATIKRDGKRWVASVVCDIGPVPEKRTVSRVVGIDVGLISLATLSDGMTIKNPRWVKQHEERIAAAGRSLSRKKRGSKNRLKAREVFRRVHQRATNSRANYLHHASKWLVGNYDLIAHEDLEIRNMVRSNLAKSIMDAAWGILLYQLRYKAESAGTYVIAVNPRGTSIKCSGCGKPVPKTLEDRQHVCGSCGLSLDRDHNAALNIKALGMSAAGLNSPSECVL